MRRFVGLVGGLVMVACATKPQPYDPDALRASKPRTLVLAADRSPPITAEGPPSGRVRSFVLAPLILGAPGILVSAAAGGAFAGAQYQAANQKRGRWMKGCELADPVDDIRDDVAEALAGELSLEIVDSNRRTKAKAPEDVINDYPGADLILDIRTSRWGIHSVKKPRSNGLVQFAVGYDGSLRLIDARKRAVIAETTCSVQFSNGDETPTMTELLEDDCALLDKGLMLSATTCAKRLREALDLE